MNLLISFLLVTQPLSTKNVIPLSRTCNRVECFDGKIFLAPRIGQSIFNLVQRDSLDPISFTDDVNYRIRDFRIRPFAIYINRGDALEKFYPASGNKETIYESADISSFTLTSAEEIILADRQTRELIFLDFMNQVKFKIENINVKDVVWYDTIVYALMTNALNRYDEYGNLIDAQTIPEQFSRILVADHRIILFSEAGDYIYESDADWHRVELSISISDICVTNEAFIVLDGLGNNLFLYSHRDF